VSAHVRERYCKAYFEGPVAYVEVTVYRCGVQEGVIHLTPEATARLVTRGHTPKRGER